MKQTNMFGDEMDNSSEQKYTTKIQSPIYEPKNKKPHELELYDDSKAKRLIREIELSSANEYEKKFLIEAARRHTVFNYQKIADYYANSNPVIQDLMEKSALIILDFEKAILYGYVRLSEDLSNQYLQEYGNGE